MGLVGEGNTPRPFPVRFLRSIAIILQKDPDILTLQELDVYGEMKAILNKFGYTGGIKVAKKKGSASTGYNGRQESDCVAIFYKTKKLTSIGGEALEITKDNSQVAVVHRFKHKENGKPIAIVTGHFKSGKSKVDHVRIVEVEVGKYIKKLKLKNAKLITDFTEEELNAFYTHFEKLLEKDESTYKKPFDVVKKNYGAILLGTKMAQLANSGIPVVFAADFNNDHDSECGSYNKVFQAFEKNISGPWKLFNGYERFGKKNIINTYKQRLGGDQDKMEDKIRGHVEDYVLFAGRLVMNGLLQLVNIDADEELESEGLVNYRYPSDHFAIGGTFIFYQNVENFSRKKSEQPRLVDVVRKNELRNGDMVQTSQSRIAKNGFLKRKASAWGIIEDPRFTGRNNIFPDDLEKIFVRWGNGTRSKYESNCLIVAIQKLERTKQRRRMAQREFSSRRDSSVTDKPVQRRRMAQREFSSRRDSPVMVRLLQEIVAAQDK